MSLPAISRPAEWDALGHRVASSAEVVRCPDCGAFRRDGAGPHAPRVVGTERRDCAGRVVGAEFLTGGGT